MLIEKGGGWEVEMVGRMCGLLLAPPLVVWDHPRLLWWWNWSQL